MKQYCLFKHIVPRATCCGVGTSRATVG